MLNWVIHQSIKKCNEPCKQGLHNKAYLWAGSWAQQRLPLLSRLAKIREKLASDWFVTDRFVTSVYFIIK